MNAAPGITYWPASYWTPSYWPAGYWGKTPLPAPILFKQELAGWLASKLGVEVHAARRPRGLNLATGVLCYAAVAGDSLFTLMGPNAGARVTIQFDCWANSAARAETLARMLYDALAGGHDAIGRANYVVANVVGERSGFEYYNDNSESGVYRESRDYQISWADPGPIR